MVSCTAAEYSNRTSPPESLELNYERVRHKGTSVPSWVREQCKASIIAILMKDGTYCEQGILVSGFCLRLSFCRYWFSGDDAASQNE